MTHNSSEKPTLDRRKQARYTNGDLSLSIAYPGIKGMLRFNPIVECIDFNSTGLQFKCNRPFQLDDRLVIDLCVQDECIYELSGLVCYTRKLEDTYLCGVRFCFEDKRMQNDDVKRTLLNIESNLRLNDEYPESVTD
ncbi:MAG: PilZ domain-containing protein [Pseudomonadales bacterium]|jgi:hypothetical protein|nr:PilZ domain-containing protein [Pseudomonadales bacterium]MDP7145189.1 PilZ domain-containing protein [Pseudomonadales bacterium]MDP7357673.1 PilZ domain-containing protein [Pseudomonadales bacterium]MDP7594046.1 PilZ domain-containing protein [Pseudomonadales bacterium]HJN49897.1 PilZ domain-containing protein [Pseudomonadales bacterium]|tara:strand:+ start:1378 stop:1788 length:411 start_codon:yes stop_codon:yes gene_type:complete